MLEAAYFCVLNLFKLSGSTEVICANKESLVGKFLASQWDQRLALNLQGCLDISVSHSRRTANRRLASSFSFRLLSCDPSELTSVSTEILANRHFSPCLFCHLKAQQRHNKLASLNIIPILPLVGSKINMEKIKKASGFEFNAENDESSEKVLQAAGGSSDVTDVNQTDTPANQGRLKTLFDEDLQCSDAARGTTHSQSKSKAKRRKEERRKRKQQLHAISDDSNTDTAGTSADKDDRLSPEGKKKPKRVMPNYFLAIRVSNPQIHSGIKIVQDSITTQNKKLQPAFIPLTTLHVTLMVMHLEDDEQVQKAREVLNQCKTRLEPVLSNSALTLTFSGLGHFRHQVLYVKISGEEEMEVLKSVENTVRETFTNEGIPSTDSRIKFNPHLTVMKLSGHNPMLRRNGIKKIPEDSYARWVDMSFGEEPVNAIHLCSMSEEDKDGFYKCVATVRFDDAANEPPRTELMTTYDIKVQDDKLEDISMEQKQETNTRTTPGDKDNDDAGENDEENAFCDEDLSKELVTWTVDDKMEDSVVNKH